MNQDIDRKTILLGGPTWTATNSTGLFLHLSDDVFVYGNGGSCLAGLLSDNVSAQNFYNTMMIDKYSKFVEYMNVKNRLGHGRYEFMAFRENDIVWRFLEHLKCTKLKKEDVWCIRTTRDPYEMFWAYLWKQRLGDIGIPTDDMINQFIIDQLEECDDCLELKELGYRIITVNLISGIDQYNKILDFIGLEMTPLQKEWISFDDSKNSKPNRGIKINQTLGFGTNSKLIVKQSISAGIDFDTTTPRATYISLREAYKDRFYNRFDILREHGINEGVL